MDLSCFKDEKGLYKGWNVRKTVANKKTFSSQSNLDNLVFNTSRNRWSGSDKSKELAAGTTDPASIRLKDITTSGFSAIVAKPPNTAVGDDTMTES